MATNASGVAGKHLRADVARIVEKLRGAHSRWAADSLDSGQVSDTLNLVRALEKTPAYHAHLTPRDRAFVRHFSAALGHLTKL